MMSLDEAISHARENAEELRTNSLVMIVNGDSQEEREACLECALEHEQLADWLTELQERREADRWIPVSERLPEESLNSVIGWDSYRERCVFVQYIDGHFQITGNDESFNIVAWKPLPKPYKENDK